MINVGTVSNAMEKINGKKTWEKKSLTLQESTVILLVSNVDGRVFLGQIVLPYNNI